MLHEGDCVLLYTYLGGGNKCKMNSDMKSPGNQLFERPKRRWKVLKCMLQEYVVRTWARLFSSWSCMMRDYGSLMLNCWILLPGLVSSSVLMKIHSIPQMQTCHSQKHLPFWNSLTFKSTESPFHYGQIP